MAGAGLAASCLWTALLDRLLAERERWGLWLPVGFAGGIGLYFELDTEPWPWLGAIAAGAGFAVALLARRSPHGAAPGVLAIARCRSRSWLPASLRPNSRPGDWRRR